MDYFLEGRGQLYDDLLVIEGSLADVVTSTMFEVKCVRLPWVDAEIAALEAARSWTLQQSVILVAVDPEHHPLLRVGDPCALNERGEVIAATLSVTPNIIGRIEQMRGDGIAVVRLHYR